MIKASKSKRKWIIISIITAILVAIYAFLRKRFKEPITDVKWVSKVPKYLDITWYDEEPDQVYKIYWSNKPGIKIKNKDTYKYVIRVSTFSKSIVSGSSIENHHFARIRAPYNWVYFIVTKSSSSTKEYEAMVKGDTTFNCKNLDVNIMKRGKVGENMAISLKVLENADIYRLYHYLPNGETYIQDYMVKGLKTVDIKLPVIEDAMVYISWLFEGFEEELQFLLYNEKISLGEDKWQTETQMATQLC